MQLLTTTIEVTETPLIPPKPPTFLPTKNYQTRIFENDELHQCLNNVITHVCDWDFLKYPENPDLRTASCWQIRRDFQVGSQLWPTMCTSWGSSLASIRWRNILAFTRWNKILRSSSQWTVFNFFCTGLWDKDLRWVRHIFLSILDQLIQIKPSHTQVSSINVTWIQFRYRYLQISWVTQPSWNRCDHLCKLGGVLNFRLDDYLWSWLCLCLCFCG